MQLSPISDGRTVRVAFSLAFATDASLPRMAFFTCQHHQPHDLLWQPSYRRHANGAKRIVEVILTAAEPAAHRHFFEQLVEAEAKLTSGALTIGPADSRITVLGRDRLTERFPQCASGGDTPRFVAYRVTVADLGNVERQLRGSGVRYRRDDGTITIAPGDAFGAAIEFANPQET